MAVRTAPGLWWAPVAGPSVFPVAGTTSPTAEAAELAARLPSGTRLEVTDAWGHLDLAPRGMQARPGDPWMVREPGPLVLRPVPGLDVHRAATPDEVIATETTVVRAAGGCPPGYSPGSIHPGEATLAQPDLHLLLGLLDGEPAATAMAAVAPGCVFVSGIATLPRHRGRGIASAMAAAAVATAPHLPAVLGTTDAGRTVYRRLGFVEVGRPVVWSRAAPAPGPVPGPAVNKG